MIRSYQAEHGGSVFYAAPTRRQRAAKTRVMALIVIAAVAASAGVVQTFNARAASFDMLPPAQTSY